MSGIRKNMQLISDAGSGDCFRACLTSILGIPNDPDLPNVDQPDWFLRWHRFLSPMGLELNYEHKACWRNGYWIASVTSKNYTTCTHAIVMHGQEVFHDPSPKERYEDGLSLLGSDVVGGGYYLEVTDSSLLHVFVAKLAGAE
jgi:hypothetical protein